MQPKKFLGQNFLRDEKILARIIKAADLKSDDLVVEVGPGTGVLTKELVRKAKKVIAIEKDDSLAKELKSHFCGNDNIEIINDDILKINLPELISSYKLRTGAYKLIANIPYYITSPIIQLFLETKYPPSEMILMAQKEVAERICSQPGQMSILAVSVQYRAKTELLFHVDKTAFWPVPEVNSAVIRIAPFNLIPSPSPYQGEGNQDEIKNFFQVVRAGFSAKRKTLLNNISSSFHIDKTEAEKKIKKAGINPAQRAQELSVEEWKKLSKAVL